MTNCDEYIARYTNKAGFVRNKLSDKVVSDIKKIKILLIFGDLQETVFFGQTVYKNLCCNSDDYNIVVTWPGIQCFFQNADEVWYSSNSGLPVELYNSCSGIGNKSKYIGVITRSLNEFFLNVTNGIDYEKYFEYFIKDEFIKKYPIIEFQYPVLLPRNSLNKIFFERLANLPKKQIVLIPYNKTRMLQNERSIIIPHYEDLYKCLIDVLLEMNYGVVCIQNDFTFDMSRIMSHDNLLTIKEIDYQKILTLTRNIGSYIDFFGNSSFVGLLSQTNTFVINERNLWFGLKKYQELNIYKNEFGYKNYFSFLKFNDPYNKELNISYFRNIIKCLNDFINETNLETEPGLHKNKQILFTEIVKKNNKVFCAKPLNLKG